LAKNGRVVQYVREAFGHCKAIGAAGIAIAFLRDIVGLPGVEFQHGDSSDVTSSYGIVTTGKLDVKSAATDLLHIEHDSKNFLAEFAYVISRHRCYEREMDGLTAQVAY
jgi:catalase